MAENEHLQNRKFRYNVAGMSRTIPIYLQSEGEEYGMTFEIYNILMAFKKAKSARFQSMMTQGNFTLEGSSSYSGRKVVICIPDSKSKLQSFVPLSFMEVIVPSKVEATIGVKRKPGEWGPGKKYFISIRTAVVVSQNLTKSLSDVIKEYFKSNTNEDNKKRNTIEASLRNISRQFQINEENLESDDAIILSAKTYLKGLNLYGGRFIDTQATIDSILASLAAKNSSNKAIANILGVSRKRIAKAKRRRAEFDSLVEAEKDKLKKKLPKYEKTRRTTRRKKVYQVMIMTPTMISQALMNANLTNPVTLLKAQVIPITPITRKLQF